MASTKDRQRKLARARAERRLKVLAERQRRKRQTYAIVALSVTLVAALGLTWALGGFDSKAPSVISGSCSWVLKDPASDPNIVDVGHPEPEGAPRTGTQTMTLKTNLGDIEATIDLSRAPCTASSFTYLAGQNFFDDAACSRLSATLQTLQCGDPKGDGTGSPSYQFADEDRPTAPITPAPTTPAPTASPTAAPTASASAPPTTSPPNDVYYKKGQVVMLSTGENTNGSQFYIITGDTSPLSAAYSIVGTVTKGMDIVDQVVAEGAVNDAGEAVAEGLPKKEIVIQQLLMSDPIPPTTAPATTAPATTTPAASPPPASPTS